MEITWTAKTETRTNMLNRSEDFRTYRTESYPGYMIEKWDGCWGVMEDRISGPILCSTRPTLAEAKTLLVFLATH
jgi:hypothetical protein